MPCLFNGCALAEDPYAIFSCHSMVGLITGI